MDQSNLAPEFMDVELILNLLHEKRGGKNIDF